MYRRFIPQIRGFDDHASLEDGVDRSCNDQTNTTERRSDDPEQELPSTVRILQYLRDNDGRVWQQELVAELDLSESSVSRQLSALTKQDRVHKFQIGRKNVVTLPEQQPEPIPDDRRRSDDTDHPGDHFPETA